MTAPTTAAPTTADTASLKVSESAGIGVIEASPSSHTRSSKAVTTINMGVKIRERRLIQIKPKRVDKVIKRPALISMMRIKGALVSLGCMRSSTASENKSTFTPNQPTRLRPNARLTSLAAFPPKLKWMSA